jgi:hypothetical protein
MKIQCACGTKIAFDIQPEMALNPVQFVCPNCGLDSSAMVNQIIRQELGVSSAPAPVPTAPPPTAPPMVAPASAARPAMRLASAHAAPAAAPASAEAEPQSNTCPRHRTHEVVEHCMVCDKPMCLECMASFGYVCSPLCRNKAEAQGMKIPVYAKQRSVIAARARLKTRLAVGAGVTVLAALAGFWFWYAWFGSVPHVAYSLKFDGPATEGSLQLCGPGQLVYLHGGELGRIDMNRTEPVWKRQLVDKASFGKLADQSIAEMVKARERYESTADEIDTDFKIPSREKIMEDMAESAIASMELFVAGENLWVVSDETMTQFDWQSGQPGKKLVLERGTYGLKRHGDELLQTELSDDLTSETTLHIDLKTGEQRKVTTQKPVPEKLVALLTASATNKPAASRSRTRTPDASSAMANRVLAENAAKRPGAPLDPQKIAAQAGSLSLPAKIALPVLIANARNQQRLFAEMDGDGEFTPRPPTELDMALDEWDSTRTIQTPSGPVLYSATLIEHKLVQREAMRAAPKKSALEGNVSAANSLELAGEMLNEMQREASSTVTENVSRYRVTVKRGGADGSAWAGEVVGPPSFHALKTVNIITAGANAIALDENNKELWKAVLNYSVLRTFDDFADFSEDEEEFAGEGQGPCVEQGDTVYIFDQGSLAAFDRNSGEARWRLPSVGIAGLWFDEKGMIYVNTTTASPDSIRYSKQIDLNDMTMSQIIKVDPKTGKTLWTREGAQHICYMWKKYIYTCDTSGGMGPDDELGAMAGVDFPAFVRIRRIDAGSGRVLWTHVQKRFPLSVSFHENTIQLMFKNEVQHLKFVML